MIKRKVIALTPEEFQTLVDDPENGVLLENFSIKGSVNEVLIRVKGEDDPVIGS